MGFYIRTIPCSLLGCGHFLASLAIVGVKSHDDSRCVLTVQVQAAIDSAILAPSPATSPVASEEADADAGAGAAE